MSKSTLRVYFQVHADRRRTAYLMRSSSFFFDRPAPSAYGLDEADCLGQLELDLRVRLSNGSDTLERYLWEEAFETRRMTIHVHPQSVVKHHRVIGQDTVPLRMMYAFSALPRGGFRVIIPRFDWWFIVEDLELAPEVVDKAISSALTGAEAQSIFRFRSEPEEYVLAWKARDLSPIATEEGADYSSVPTLSRAADEWVSRSDSFTWVGKDDAIVSWWSQAELAPPSLLLVGRSGVGKTAWVRMLARHLRKQRREAISTPNIWATTKDRIVAGTTYLGMWQERCLAIIAELASHGDYLFIDRLSAFVAPWTDGGSLAEIFQPSLAAGEIMLIAECTQGELERAQRIAPSFVSAFRIVQLDEPRAEEVAPLITQYAARRDREDGLASGSIERMLRYLDAFDRAHAFPGKAFRFVDWLIAEKLTETTLHPNDVARAYARYSGLPVQLISGEERVLEHEIAAQLKTRVIGQPHACEAAAGVLARFKAGMNDPEKPIGSFFFTGPTGVGKTELAKQIAYYLFGSEERLIRFDMSEFMMRGSSLRLIDAQTGSRSLATRVRETPLSLVLFDEIEKAHPEVFDLLLGILGEGRLSDSNGHLVDFRMTMVVMTSNLGVDGQRQVGFDATRSTDFQGRARQHFRPEFWARIDHALSFFALTPKDINAIVDLMLDALRTRTGLVRRNIQFAVSADARAHLARTGYHPEYGARPLKRLIEDALITPVAIHLAASPQLRDLVVHVRLDASGVLTLELPESARGAEGSTLKI